MKFASYAAPLLGLGILAALLFGGKGESVSVPDAPPVVTPEPAAPGATQPVEILTYNPGSKAKDREIAELKSQLAERKRAANHWYKKAKGKVAKQEPALTYEGGNCPGGKCYAPSRGFGRRNR